MSEKDKKMVTLTEEQFQQLLESVKPAPTQTVEPAKAQPVSDSLFQSLLSKQQPIQTVVPQTSNFENQLKAMSEQFSSQLSALQLENQRQQVLRQHNISTKWETFVKGNSSEELEASANAVKQLIKEQKTLAEKKVLEQYGIDTDKMDAEKVKTTLAQLESKNDAQDDEELDVTKVLESLDPKAKALVEGLVNQARQLTAQKQAAEGVVNASSAQDASSVGTIGFEQLDTMQKVASGNFNANPNAKQQQGKQLMPEANTQNLKEMSLEEYKTGDTRKNALAAAKAELQKI